MKKFDSLCQVTDLILLDIKHIDDTKHTELTGHSNKNVLSFAKYLSQKKIPDMMPEFDRSQLTDCKTLVDVIIATQLFNGSKKELKRLIEQGGVEVNEQRVNDINASLPEGETIVRVGKKLFFKIHA